MQHHCEDHRAAISDRCIPRRGVMHLLLGAAMSTATMSATAMAQPTDEPAPISVAQAILFIRQSGERLITILDGSGDAAAKREQLKALISDAIDVDGIARFALGRFWSNANVGERAEYVRLFPAVLVSDIDKAFGAYRGVRFSIDRGTQADDAIHVTTTVFRPDYSLQVTWVVGAIGGTAKILDIVAGGFSMRLSQRDACVSLLRNDNNSIQALIETLRRQAAVVS
jgi:phospholipid transport system substrate-binding protein